MADSKKTQFMMMAGCGAEIRGTHLMMGEIVKANKSNVGEVLTLIQEPMLNMPRFKPFFRDLNENAQ